MHMRFQDTAVARPHVEPQRWSNLATVRQAIAAIEPDIPGRAMGLDAIVALCKMRTAASGAGNDRQDVRSQLLSIVCAWDLSVECLEDQSEECLAYLARFVEAHPVVGHA